jgi:hypothetical protein
MLVAKFGGETPLEQKCSVESDVKMAVTVFHVKEMGF